MATELNKKLTRESTREFDGRRINVNLNPDQTVSFKLKGMKTGEIKIDILELYKQLVGVDDTSEEPKAAAKGSITINNTKQEKGSKSNPLIPLSTLRSLNAISTLDTMTMAKFDGIIKETIDHINKTEKVH